MKELATAIPDVEVLLALSPEEVGGRMLLLLRKLGHGKFHPDNLLNDIWNSVGDGPYPQNKQREVEIAIAEGWAWLENEGLVIREPGYNGQNGWRILSRRGIALDNVQALADFSAARLLPRELLHPAIAEQAWLSFVRGSFATAVFESMRAVEIAVREAAGYPNAEHGVSMIRRAFNPDNGPLSEMDDAHGEREALMHLFAGAIGSFKNPHSHRNIDIDDPSEAARVILFAGHLLSILDGRKR